MKMILFVLAEGFEELEFVAPFDILKRGGLEVVTATLGANLTVRSVRNLLISADLTLEQASQTSFDLVFLPGGGPGTRNLRKSPRVGELVRQQIASGREVAAICAAPLVLGDVGLLRDRKATCFPDCMEELRPMAKVILEDRVVQDGPVFTSRGAGSAAEFGFFLLSHLGSAEKSQEVFRQMQFTSGS